MHQTRVILFHKHASSGRTVFLRFSYNSVCAFKPLPELAMLLKNEQSPVVAIHPSAVILQTEKQLGLSPGELQVMGEYSAWVDVASGPVNVLLAGFTSIDPPLKLAQGIQARFIDLTQARDLAQVELELLRKAYELILGG